MTIKFLRLIFPLFLITFIINFSNAAEFSIKEIPLKDKKGPWPEFEVITTINASPLESVAIYYALDYQQEYVPGVLKSIVQDQPNPLEAITYYEFNTPWPIPNSTYTNGSKLEKIGRDGFKVSWWFITNSSADDLFGSATFISDKDKTKLIYRSYIAPKSIFASFFKSTAKSDISNTIKEIRNHIEMLKQSESPILSKYKTKILDALNNKYTYKKYDLE